MVFYNSSVDLETLASIPVFLFPCFFSEVFPVMKFPAPLSKGCCPTASKLPMCRQDESKVNRRCSVTLDSEEPCQVCTKSRKEGQKQAVVHQICSLNTQPALLFPWLYLSVSASLLFQHINHQPVSDNSNKEEDFSKMLKDATNFVKIDSCAKEQDLIPAFTEGNAPEYAWLDVRLGTGHSRLC